MSRAILLLIIANLIALLEEYGSAIDGFRDRVGDDFARGHKEATGGIIAKRRIHLVIGQDGRSPCWFETGPEIETYGVTG